MSSFENANPKTTFFFIFKKDELVLHESLTDFVVPSLSEFERSPSLTSEDFCLFESEEVKYYVLDVEDSFIIPSGYTFKRFYECRDFHLHDVFFYASRGYQLLNWNRKHRFCGACGTLFHPMQSDRSKTCPACNNLLFPQTSPAIITLIMKDHQLLLAHNKNFPEGLYSLIAGFVELGETFEEAIHREVLEEVGIKVKNIRYFSSQPWPFPNSLMIGFIADYDSGDITPDGTEITEADWFTPDHFPLLPHPHSIARKMIEWYRHLYINH